MVHESESPPPKIPRFSEPERDGCECETGEIDLGLELGLGTNFNTKMIKYKKRVVDDDDRRKNKDEEVSIGFTFMQRMEFEQQACIFNYIQYGIKVPYQLLYPLLKSVEKSIDSTQFHFIPNFLLDSAYRIGLVNSDPEPGRCKRTDGKKWRCAKEALPDNKYCEKHLHRGRHRSRKLVESLSGSSSGRQGYL